MPVDTSVSHKVKFGYGLGHILNDLSASIWFTYLLLYFNKVLEFNNTYSGIILFIGQIADGVSTVFVGIFSDAGDNYWLCRKFGRRKSWHLFGVMCTLLTFPFIFLHCIYCYDTDQFAQMIYYSGFVVIFQFGWACVQISHLAMIPELTESSDQRSGLTAIRNASGVLSNITVYLVAWIFLGMRNNDVSNRMIRPSDDDSFRNIVLVCLSIGAICAVLFHCLVPTVKSTNTQNVESGDTVHAGITDPSINQNEEPRDEQVTEEVLEGEGTSVKPKMTISQWFMQPQLYQVSIVYLSTRLFVNLSQAYIPLYLQVTLQLPATSIATIPLVMFISGFAASLVLERTKTLISRKITFPIGSFLGVVGCLWIFFGCEYSDCAPTSDYSSRQTYGVALFFGASSSIMLVGSLSLTADFIGQDVDSSAFVYGFMSLTDKVCNGVAVVFIQDYIPHVESANPEIRNYFRSVLVWGSGAAAVAGFVALLSLLPFEVGQRRVRASRTTNVVEVDREPDERTPLLQAPLDV